LKLYRRASAIEDKNVHKGGDEVTGYRLQVTGCFAGYRLQVVLPFAVSPVPCNLFPVT
jgi:hypothetical protein